MEGIEQNELIEIWPQENEGQENCILHCFEFRGYYIEILPTIFGGRRVAIREKGEDWYYCNWCAGDNPVHLFMLVGFAKSVIEKDFPKTKFASSPKPYYKDSEFTERMQEIGFEPLIFNSK